VLLDGRPTPVQIAVGVSDGTLTEVLSGPLQPGDKVLTGVEVGGGNGARPASPAGPGGPARRPF
jgi:HlyD family secretion protein